uniref:Uncharacterized protein n=1 Tax=Anguilla anguilla TaxID=7936 RepID=A0A0E9VBP6_ANGAN
MHSYKSLLVHIQYRKKSLH